MRARGAFFSLFLVGGGYLVWRNRFAIQRQLEAWGIQTPLMKESLKDTVGSIASKVSGKIEKSTGALKEASRQSVGGNY